MNPRETLGRFDAYLVAQGLSLDAVVIGGAALALLGITTRQTKDCDILHPALSQQIVEAARSFAVRAREQGEPLQDDWLNNGPASLCELLPAGWQQRTHLALQGQALILRSLARGDLLKTKLFGLCDRALDLGDCLALYPTPEELQSALPWLEMQDGNPDWPAHVRATLADLEKRLGHVV